ncbi:MAG TPA: hypothetical protein VEX62_08840 [Candidatus Limnocylindrales bacterium]|nr:hypothetical protein [Candidatus Limnocylindrales bacterium]
MAVMPRPFASPSVQLSADGSAPLRRCTFRRMTLVSAPREPQAYDVACMFPDRRTPVPLGNVEDARPICASCTYSGIFRADAD